MRAWNRKVLVSLLALGLSYSMVGATYVPIMQDDAGADVLLDTKSICIKSKGDVSLGIVQQGRYRVIEYHQGETDTPWVYSENFSREWKVAGGFYKGVLANSSSYVWSSVSPNKNKKPLTMAELRPVHKQRINSLEVIAPFMEPIPKEGEQIGLLKSPKEGIYKALIHNEVLKQIPLERNKIKNRDGRLESAPIVPVVQIDVLDIKEQDDLSKVFVRILEETYMYKDGIFYSQSGGHYVQRYDFSKDNVVAKVVSAEDGMAYKGSIVKMAEGDMDIYGKLMGRLNEPRQIQRTKKDTMKALKKAAAQANITNFTHQINQIPGYTTEVVYVPDEKEGSDITFVVKQSDYDKVQAERKQIVGPFESGPHGASVECIVYHAETGLATNGYVSYSH